MNNLFFIVDSQGAPLFSVAIEDGELSPVITGGQTGRAAGEAAEASPPETESPAAGFPVFSTVLLYAVMIVAMYFILFRPQRKQAKELKNLQNNIRVGDGVMTQSGLYGRVADIGSDVFIVEFGVNKTVKIPVAKSEIAAIKAPKTTGATQAPLPEK